YGYTRGGFFKQNQDIHIPGCGDFKIASISFLPDPCPLPSKERQEKRRSLNQKEKLIYAPFSGVGGVLYDKDAVYIDLGGSHSHGNSSHDNSQTTPFLSSILNTSQTIDEKIENSDGAVKFFSSVDVSNPESDESDSESEVESESNLVASQDDTDTDDDAADSDFENNFVENANKNEKGDEERDNYSFDESDSESVMMEETLKWKDSIIGKASIDFYNRQASTKNVQKLVYSQNLVDSDAEEDENNFLLDGLIKVVKKHSNNSTEMKHTLNSIECTVMPFSYQNWNEENVLDLIRDCFVTGKWEENEDAEMLMKNADLEDFEDLESPTTKLESNENTSEVQEDDQETVRLEKKRLLKEAFDSNYDEGGKEKKDEETYYDNLKAQIDKQGEVNKSEFEGLPDEVRVQYEGYRPGMYVRMEINLMPSEFIENFDPSYPVIVGGLLSGESDVGFVQVRIKKHRWYKKIMKSKDPLIFSMGWKRFQTIPLYSIQDHNGRNRLLKYTPQHLHCHASFWGPITPQGTGFIAIQSVSESTPDFRIAATGVVLNLDKSTTIVKKLKLIGSALKIFKKTAFIKGMFNSALEVTKFEGASIRTVSGIRGQIKKAIKAPAGAFRATFEDKILLSDIVFMRTWYTMSVPKFYTYVNTLLMPDEMKLQWQGMKCTGQLRHEKGLKPIVNADSLYSATKRKVYSQKPLVIPKALQKELPYSAKPKFLERKQNRVQRVTVVREPEEKKVESVLKMVRAANKEKKRKDRQLLMERVARHKKEMQLIENRKTMKERQLKKQILRRISKTKNSKKT
ncbi:ribosome biogenesis protein BMS1-like protein, partial [Leptotrombidium deliense]